MADTVTEVSWTPVITTAVISGALFFFGLFYFVRSRSKHANRAESPKLDIYEKRTIWKSHRSPPPWTGVGYGLFQSAKDALSMDGTELLRCVGLDTYVFLRFLLFGFWATLVPSILAVCVLLPINSTGGGEADGFNKLTLGNIPEESNRLWCAALLWYFYIPFMLWLLHKEWKHFFPLRYEYLAKGDVDSPPSFRYTTIAENVPVAYRSNKALQEYFEKLFPGTVYGAEFCKNTSSLQKLITERMSFINEYEVADAKIHAYPDKPIPETRVGGKKMLCCSRGGDKVEAMPYYKEKIDQLNVEVDKERRQIFIGSSDVLVEDVNADVSGVNSIDSASNNSIARDIAVKVVKNFKREVNSGFVMFNSLAAKQSAVQVELTGRYRELDVFPAPDPNSIIWNNVMSRLNDQTFAQAIWNAVWCTGILFWAVIVGFIQSISNLDSVVEKLSLGTIDTTQVWYGIVAGYLPVVAFMLLMWLLPVFINFAAREYIRLKSMDLCDSYTFTWHQMFQFANLWLIIIGGSIFNQLSTIFDDIGSVVEIIASAIPGASVFFLNLIISTWGLLGISLSQVVEILVTWIMNKITPDKAKPQRVLDAKRSSNPITWGLEIPPIVFIFLSFCVYLPITPVLAPFVTLYFGTAIVVYKHMCLHVYMQDTEGGGIIWFPLFNYIMVCIYMSCITFMGYMGVKKMAGIAIVGIVPLVAAIVMHFYICKAFVKPLKYLSMEIAQDCDVNDPVVDLELQLYHQPCLRTDIDVREPLPYRRDGTAGKICPSETEVDEEAVMPNTSQQDEA